MESAHINFKESREDKVENLGFLKTNDLIQNRHKSMLIRQSHKNSFSHEIEMEKGESMKLEKSFEQKSEKITDEEIISHLINQLANAFQNTSPFIYMNPEQQKKLMQKISFFNFFGKEWLYKVGDTEDLDAYILFEGEFQIFNRENHMVDLVNSKMNFFGYGGPIFKTRSHSILVDEDSIIGVIKSNDYLDILCPFSKFSKFISRNILNKDKVFNRLNEFKYHCLNSIDKSNIDISETLSLYKRIDSCLHVKANNQYEIDFDAWTYALCRLPDNIFSTYTFILTNLLPKILSLDDITAKNLIPRVNTELRNRDVFTFQSGKSVVIVRELETDVLDFIANLCIHMIECKKVRLMLNSPIIISYLYNNKNSDINKILNEIQSLTNFNIDIEGFQKLVRLYPKNLPEKLLSLLLHYEDYTISIKKGYVNENDPTENFIQNLWNNSKELLEISSHVDLVDDLIVDIMQGSKRTLINCISPHIYQNKEKIILWAEDEIKKGNLKLKTPSYAKSISNKEKSLDLLMAYSYYYYENFPNEKKEKTLLEEKYGIKYITQTFSTGVAVILINPNKFNKENIDQTIGFNGPISKNHLIIHIGYTFGAQSKEIIKPILLLFGSKARSLNIMGKAGGLSGKRTDILVANKVFLDKNNDMCNLNLGNFDKKELEEMIINNSGNNDGSNFEIHIGPMLTVAGTIVQNKDLLNFYKCVMGCVGLEMEGYFYAKEIESATKHLILSPNFITRCFYYISDLPLDPEQNLANEHGIVNWEEGVQTMNAIQRYILKQIFTK